jgi:pyruvate dehydrogenase E2 component (dihydrolipoamide acetyltransferase)
LASKDILVPDLGNFKDVAVIELLVQPGDTVQVDTPLITLETEKATMDVPSPEAGIIEKLHLGKGSLVSAGSLIATVQTSAAASAPQASASASAAAPAEPPAAPPKPAAPPASPASPTSPAKAASPAPAPAPAPKPAAAKPAAAEASDAPQAPAGPSPSLPPVSEEGIERAHASPSVRKFARELGADLLRITGSGQKGRITEEDVKAYVKAALARVAGAGTSSAAPGGEAARAWPAVAVPDFAQFGPIEVKPLSRVQRISGPRLHASWVNLPHVTQFDEADITQLEEARRGLKAGADIAGVKLTALAFIARACVKALQEFPQFNSSLDARGENLILKKYLHLGIAADTPHGLMVPVIRDADRKDIYEIARSIATLSQKARAGKLAATDMQGGCFSISSLGSLGGTGFTPIINAPEVAILGVSRSTLRPVYQDGNLVPRLILPLSLSYDHRVIDGVNGARFMNFITAALADVHGLLEAVP